MQLRSLYPACSSLQSSLDPSETQTHLSESCDRIELGDSYKRGFFSDIFQIDWYRQTREHRIRAQPEQLKGVTELTLKMGC